MAVARLLALLLLPAAFAAVVVSLGTGSIWPEAPRTREASSVVTAGGRSFTNRRGLAMWLKANGRDYRTWAKRHPAAAARLGRTPAARSAPARSAVVDRQPPTPPIEQHGRSVLLALAAGVVALLSVAVARRLPRVSIPGLSLVAYGATAVRFVATSAASAQRLPARRPRSPPFIERQRPQFDRAARDRQPLLVAARILRTSRRFAVISIAAAAATAGAVLAGASGRRRTAVVDTTARPPERAVLRTAARVLAVPIRVASAFAIAVWSGALHAGRDTPREDIAFGVAGILLGIAVGISIPLLLGP